MRLMLHRSGCTVSSFTFWASVIGLDIDHSSILFLVVFFIIDHSLPMHSMLFGQIDKGKILSIRFLFHFIHCFT